MHPSPRPMSYHMWVTSVSRTSRQLDHSVHFIVIAAISQWHLSLSLSVSHTEHFEHVLLWIHGLVC